MGNEHAKPSDRLKYIEREVNSLRSSIRSTRRSISKETKEDYIQNLVKLSGDASALKGKVKPRNLQQAQRQISNTMNEILTKLPQESELDMGAVETSSFIQMPVNKRQTANKNSSERPAKKQKNQGDFAKKGSSTLQDIQEKFKTLEPQIDVAIETKDTTQLRVHQETIKVLVTDLEMIDVPEDTPIDETKKNLDALITTQYQRIGKAMKEIKRNRDISYLVKQTKKEKAIKELEEIQKALEEAESLLNQSLKSNDVIAMKKIRENLIIINQKLSSVEAPEEKTRETKRQLSDKITWFYQYINDSSKNSSQTDISKAQSSYEDIIRDVARGKNKDKEEIKVKLQSLQYFINNIKEDDENSLKRKQQLLNNVKQSFSFILDDENKANNDSDGIPKKPESGYKEVDTFYDTWKAIQKKIRSTTFPTDEFPKIDKILEDIQNSIAQTRLQISEKRNLESGSSKKLNVSTPNLSPSKTPMSKFGSSLSIDSAGQLIKARAKVFNLTPEVHNINDQPVVLRNKKFYKMNSEIAEDNRFSKIEEIKTQVNYIKEKFPESQQKQHLKNKLESYVKILEDYVYHKNQAIANSAKLLRTDIQEMLQGMSQIQEAMNTTAKRRLSIEESFENIVGIQEAVDKIQKGANSLTGRKDSYEYKKLKEELLFCKRRLEEMKIPPQYDMIQQQKEEILKRIKQVFSSLEYKYEHSGTVKTKQKLNELKEKVTRFSGGYKGVLYNKLEKDLNKLLVDVSDAVNDRDVADQIVKEAEKHLKILENRATKDQSFRRTLSDGRPRFERTHEEALAKLKSDLLDIKRSIDTTPTNGVNLFIGLRSRLDLVKLGLDQLKILTEEEEKQREVLYSEEESLKNVVEAKISLARQSIRQWPLEQDRCKRDGEELLKIEEKFRSLKPEIDNFVGTTSDNKFYELDESSIRLVLKMDKLHFSKGTENHQKKINLLKEIYNYGDLLDKRAKETEDVVDLEREIYDIEKNFERYVRLNDLENLLDKLSALKKKIKNIETNRNLQSRKQHCAKRADALFSKVTATEVKNTEGVVLRRNSKDPAVEISKIEQYFGSIKKEIDEFVGLHTDTKYIDLEENLTTLLPKLDNFKLPENSELQARKIRLLKDIHLCCDILDKKARETEMIQEIRKQLNSINAKIDDFKNTSEELKDIDTELRSVQAKIGKLKTGEDKKMPLMKKFEYLLSQYNRFRRAKEPPKNNYIGSTSFLTDVDNLKKTKVPSRTPEGIEIHMTKLQQEIDRIKPEVTSFIGSEESEEFKTIEESLLLLHLKISKLMLPNSHELYKKQLELEKNVQDSLNVLDERAQDVDNLKDIEKELDTVTKRLTNEISAEDKDALDERLISLQIKLGKLQVNDDLNQRKGECTNKILFQLKKLKETPTINAENSDGAQISGNVV